jgi:dihydroflavonol-4-reductase
MKALVTGANGLLASNLVRELADAGYQVRGLVRANSNLLSLNKVDAELINGDLTSRDDLRKALSGCEVVVHAAANTCQWPTNYEAYRKINVQATKMIIEEAGRRSISRFIFVGSANAFDPGSKEIPGTEGSAFSFHRKSGYMISKYIAQQLVLAETKRTGFPAIVVNPTFMLGKFDAKPSSGQIILMALRNPFLMCPPGGKNFVHVTDVAQGIVNAIRVGKTGECYLMANENLSYREFFEKLGNALHLTRKHIRLPAGMVYLAGSSGSIYEKITGKPARLDRLNAGLLCSGFYYSPQKAVCELKMPQTPIINAIEDSAEWFRQHGYLSRSFFK